MFQLSFRRQQQCVFLLCLLSICNASIAQQDKEAMTLGEKEKMNESEVVDQTPLTRLGTEYENSIRLLQNRFRIDHEVSEITMVFFRRFGSAPVVLVKPDGAKIFQGDADDDKVTWFDSATFDMIKIKNPVPGPWQAVGQILPESRVMVVSEIRLHAEPLPTLLFSGEILKQTATLSNGGEVIDTRQFSDVVQLRMQFVSTNNPDFNNFGSQTQDIATFTDNGLGMDERPLDGVYTGQYNLTIPEGEWRSLFTVSTPMFSREQMGEPLRLFPNPVSLSVEKAEEGEGYHSLMIDADRENVDITSLLIDGKVTYPNGDVQNFSLSEQSSEARVHEVINYEYGIFRAKATVFGKTRSGRDFILDVPEFTFLVEEPELENALDGQDESNEGGLVEADTVVEDSPQEDLPPVEEDNTRYYLIIALANLGVLLIGGGLIWWLMRDKAAKAEKPKKDSSSFFKKLFKKRKSESEKTESEKKEESEIADLSMPES